MILEEISSYVKLRHKVSEQALAKNFNISRSSIEAMLSIYINKGIIIKEVHNNQASTESVVYYRWLKAGEIATSIII